jgi:predicted lipoprotein with Yx(FWY)xxD motif
MVGGGRRRHKAKEQGMKKQLGSGLYILAVAAVLAGCGGGGSGTSSSPAGPTAGGSMGASASASPASPSAATSGGSSASASSVPAAAPVLKTASSTAGQIVVDARGISVYVFAKDVKGSASTCTGTCASNWPPVTTASDSPAVEGVTGTVGSVPTPGGRKQLTLNGLPLYFFAKDKAPGDTLGEGVGGVWYLVSPAGDMVKASSGAGY